MAALMTMLDIAKMNGSDALVGLVDEASRETPELTGRDAFNNRQLSNVGGSRTIKGLLYKSLVRTSLPQVGFRDPNNGTPYKASVYENRTVETFTMNPRWAVDQAVADRHEDGPGIVMALEAEANVQSGLMTVAKQFYYGSGADSKGHPGLMQYVDSTMVINATGTAPDTGSSVWAVKYGPQNVLWVWGNKGQFKPTEISIRDIVGPNGSPYSAYFQEMFAYPGLQFMHRSSAGRIKNLTEETGKKLTDGLIGQLLAKFPIGTKPDVLFMTMRSAMQLKDARTAASPTGLEAEFPTTSNGIPICVTDNLSNTEAIA